jgi:hypothetical protein
VDSPSGTPNPRGDIQNAFVVAAIKNPWKNSMALMETGIIFNLFDPFQAGFFDIGSIFSHNNLLVD